MAHSRRASRFFATSSVKQAMTMMTGTTGARISSNDFGLP